MMVAFNQTDDLTPAQAAKVMKRSRQFVLELIKAGELEARNENGPAAKRPRYLIPPGAIAAWRAKRLVVPLSEQEKRVRSMPRLEGVLSARRAARRALSPS